MRETPSPKKYSKHYFLSDCDGWKEFLKGGVAKRLLTVLKFAEINRIEKFLDVGCGRGELLDEFRKRGIDAIGVDYSLDSTKISKQFGPIVRASSSYLPFRPKQFDLITLIDVVEHLDREDKIQTMKIIKSLLKQDGTLIIHTGSKIVGFLLIHVKKLPYHQEVHVGLIFPWDLKKLLIKKGFKATKIIFDQTEKKAKKWKIPFLCLMPSLFQSYWIVAKSPRTSRVQGQRHVIRCIKEN